MTRTRPRARELRTALTFIAQGHPAGKGEVRTYTSPDGCRDVTEHPPNVRRFQSVVEKAAAEARLELAGLDEQWLDPLNAPCSVEFEYRVPAPSARKRKAERLGILWNTVDHDVEKLCRTVIDGMLRAGVIANPARIVTTHAVKYECSNTVLVSSFHGVKVTVRELTCDP